MERNLRTSKLRTFSLSLSPERDERIYQAVRLYSYTLKQVAEAVGLSYSTMSVIAEKIAGGQEKKKNKDLTRPI